MVNTILELQHIEKFYEVLYMQMLKIAGLQLGLCTLHRINLPGITIMENRVSLCIFFLVYHNFLLVYIKIQIFLSKCIYIILFKVMFIFTI